MAKNKTQSFIVTIRDTQHESWQGNIEWIDSNKTIAFRSALELIKLIDSAVDQKENSKEI